MIDVTYDVYCDAEDCEATFSYESFNVVSDLRGIVHNLRGRGWVRGRDGRTTCPLHQRGE